MSPGIIMSCYPTSGTEEGTVRHKMQKVSYKNDTLKPTILFLWLHQIKLPSHGPYVSSSYVGLGRSSSVTRCSSLRLEARESCP